MLTVRGVSALNCWEYTGCGLEPGGAKVSEFGVCPVAADGSADGLNEGKNGGRMCWAIPGALCGGRSAETFADIRLSCLNCDFHRLVRQEEGPEFFLLHKPGQILTRGQLLRLAKYIHNGE